MNQIFWNYFLAIERDAENLSRFIEFDKSNFLTYSIENARILMAATQDIDVLFKLICGHFGNKSRNEKGYRPFFQKSYPNMLPIKVQIAKYSIELQPFLEWQRNNTPSWWTANNKVKHARNKFFDRASLSNLLNAVAGLFIANIYYYHEVINPRTTFESTPILFSCDGIFMPVKLISSIALP